MINMQSTFLILFRGYSETQAGIMFFVFGMSQFLFQTPAGYLFDYTEQKVLWLSVASVATTLLTLFTAFFATEKGGNLGLMVFIKFLQGAVTSFIPPGLNSITRGIVGGNGMTEQVAVNEMMNHLGTAIIVLIGSFLGYALYYHNPSMLFFISPVACAGVLFFLNTIPGTDIDHNAARGLDNVDESSSQPESSYDPPKEDSNVVSKQPISSQPSFNFDWKSITGSMMSSSANQKAESPLKLLRDPILQIFILAVFLFHMSNGTVLPLVMQTLALGGDRSGIVLSGLCIVVAQLFMVVSARLCGLYSVKYGRKPLFLIGLFSVPIRCLILTILTSFKGGPLLQFIILATQILDGVGAGVFGTMYILVTSDLSQGTGRFNLTLGLTTAAMSIGGTVSGYLGEALAYEFHYQMAFLILMILSLAPALLYLFAMPETLQYSNPSAQKAPESEMAQRVDDESAKDYKQII